MYLYLKSYYFFFTGDLSYNENDNDYCNYNNNNE